MPFKIYNCIRSVCLLEVAAFGVLFKLELFDQPRGLFVQRASIMTAIY